ncbi:hypothetical protein [Actinomadura rudentiformis]|uniref:Uncharacterized protein n=1 Tax=Actinomadura rudentiformis TaxID=359158 RepID=A0A6H9Z0L4_9ACTN|nr:hypothetical protein [Actinomadura rudentiformis]KAB2347411.1 hypothetical protein F8566_20630 [Actinomadura rudentiformis]
MSEAAFHHLSRPRLDGPAERTLVEPWLTHTPTNLALNTYMDVAEPEVTVAALAPVEPLPVYVPVTPRRVAALAA